MTDVLLISHEGFASGARKAVELIIGEQNNFHCLELTAEKGIEIFKAELIDKITTLTLDNNSIIILADLKSGTPYNCALATIAHKNLWQQAILFSGVNLNLLLEVLMMGDDIFTTENQNEVLDIAKQGIFLMNKTAWEQSNQNDEE